LSDIAVRAVRAMRAGETEALADVWIAAWKSVPVAVDFDARRGWFVARLEALARAGVDVLVSHGDGGQAVGFVTIERATGALDQLCVAPRHFGDGTARLLLDAAKGASPGRIALDVNADNARALAFYRREGFVETGASVNPLSGLPTLAMEWSDPSSGRLRRPPSRARGEGK
jgi:putative acetyltransferase